jgi:tellurite methyltransferase
VNDPSYNKNVRSAQKKSEYTFYRPKSNTYIHFFTQNELDHYFNGYEKIKASETFMLDIGHGEPHYHSTIEVLYKK